MWTSHEHRPQEGHGECEGEDVVGVGAVEVVELELAERHDERLQDGLGRVLKVVPRLQTEREVSENSLK